MKKFLLGLAIILFALSTTPSQAAFPDTSNYDWKDAIEYLTQEGIIKGYADGSFQPHRSINRAEFTKIVVGGFFTDIPPAERDCFPDVPADAWFAKYVCFAKEEGFLKGYPDGTFKPGQTITQPEALKIIFNTAEEDVQDAGGEWFQTYLDHAEYIGMLYFDTERGAFHEMTRGEISYFIAWLTTDETQVDNQIPFEEFYPGTTAEDFAPMAPEDCYPGELYDAVDQVCYIECDTEAECIALEDEIFGASEEIYDDFADDFDEFEPGEGDNITTYAVSGDNIELVEHNPNLPAHLQRFQTDLDAQREIWEYFTRLIPLQARPMIAQFTIFTDDKDGTLAAVSPLGDNPAEWEMIIDIQDAFSNGQLNKKELAHTLIHEFGHILTLNAKQVPPQVIETDEQFEEEKQKCYPQRMLEEGCPLPQAYISRFFQKFWRKLLPEWEAFQQIEDERAYEDATFEFYENHRNEFVTDYAATNPGEDIAESWTAFVMKKKPTGNAIKDQKVLFFYDFPELVKLRKTIAQRL